MIPKLGCEFDPQLQWNKLAVEANACHINTGEAETRGTWGSVTSQPVEWVSSRTVFEEAQVDL